MIIIGIMAVDPKGIIGINGRLPWNYPSELEHFHQTTNNQVIVMGRKTFETLPLNILRSRIPVIFSRNKSSLYCNNSTKYTFVSSVQEFLSIQSSWSCLQIFMIGGAEIAHLFLEHNLISEFLITEIHESYVGNTYFNLGLLNYWNKTIITKTKNYTICRLKQFIPTELRLVKN